jgi:hypothetical protein
MRELDNETAYDRNKRQSYNDTIIGNAFDVFVIRVCNADDRGDRENAVRILRDIFG